MEYETILKLRQLGHAICISPNVVIVVAHVTLYWLLAGVREEKFYLSHGWLFGYHIRVRRFWR
jgi:hypothetical protein